MESKENAPSPEALRGALLRLAVAHNRAVLAGVSVALAIGIALCGGALALGRGGPARLLALPLLAAGLVIAWRGIRLHRHVVRDLGAGRAAAAALATALLDRGGAAPIADIEATFARPDLARALDFLGPIRLAWTEPDPAGGGERLVLDRARLAAVLDASGARR